MVQAYFWRMLNNRFVSGSTVSAVTCSDVLTKQGAFQFDIDLKVPWVMTSFVGGHTARIIERGRVDLEKRVMTLICTNATLVHQQFIQH